MEYPFNQNSIFLVQNSIFFYIVQNVNLNQISNLLLFGSELQIPNSEITANPSLQTQRAGLLRWCEAISD
jgi:hypothetical protein